MPGHKLRLHQPRRSTTPAIDRDKSPLLDADHDAIRTTDAPRQSPHIRDAATEPGDDVITYTTTADLGFTLPLRDAEPIADDILSDPVRTEAIAAAILNHPAFVVALPNEPDNDAISPRPGWGG
ncbi:hypothetical protein, partial [Streptomyces sp. YGL11-2]|uniref:hypothetical protein n=1 Tax=Streptomyces sp. YGL11-2 TaxID=3414028 RepID=UPI003CF8FA66